MTVKFLILKIHNSKIKNMKNHNNKQQQGRVWDYSKRSPVLLGRVRSVASSIPSMSRYVSLGHATIWAMPSTYERHVETLPKLRLFSWNRDGWCIWKMISIFEQLDKSQLHGKNDGLRTHRGLESHRVLP